MSTNNQLVIIEKEDKFYIYENYCVDNYFVPSEHNLHIIKKEIRHAINWCESYMKNNIVEYNYIIRLKEDA